MAKTKREFGQGPIFTITNYIFWFLLGNFYFLILNLPMLFIMLTVAINEAKGLPLGFGILALVCFIPIGPAAAALLSTMGKIVREKDIVFTRSFFQAYKNNFVQATIIWTLELVILAILYVDIRYISVNHFPQYFVVFLYVLMAYVFIIGLYVLPILSRFNMRTINMIKLSMYYSVKKFYISILNVLAFVIIYFIIFKISALVLIFVTSILAFSIMFEQGILLEIEENLSEGKPIDNSLEQ